MIGIVILFTTIVGVVEIGTLKRHLEAQIQNRIAIESMKLDEFIVSSYEALQFLFSSAEDEDEENLDRVKAYLDRMDKPLKPIKEDLDRHAIFGNYDIYLIGKDRIVHRSTLAMDVGLDFHDFPYAMKIFDQLEMGRITRHISAPFYMPLTNDFRRYLLARSKDSSFFVQISHNFFPSQGFAEKLRRIRERSPEVREIDVYFLANGMLNSVGSRKLFKDKKHYFKQMNQLKRKFLERFQKETGVTVDLKRAMEDPDYIHDLFRRSNKLHYTLQPERKKVVLYYASENSFTRRINQETIIIREVYDVAELYREYYRNLSRILFGLMIMALLLLFLIWTVKFLLADRIRGVVESLERGEALEQPWPRIVEFERLQKAIEEYRNALAQKNRELEQLSYLDPLTESYNRRFFNKMLAEKIYSCERYGKNFALLIFDIDNFKTINDRYGHDVGDRVLKELSEFVQKKIRKSDLFFRLGGEEFAVIFSPMDSLEDAVEKADELRKEIARHHFGLGRALTVSMGISLCVKGDDTESIFRRVDRYLYRSKERGKNTVSSVLNDKSAAMGPYC